MGLDLVAILGAGIGSLGHSWPEAAEIPTATNTPATMTLSSFIAYLRFQESAGAIGPAVIGRLGSSPRPPS